MREIFKNVLRQSGDGQEIIISGSKESLRVNPEVDFSQLFVGLTSQVMTALDAHKFTIVGGVSGSGKTELFLGQRTKRNPDLMCGGIVDHCNDEEIQIYVADLQSALEKELIKSVVLNEELGSEYQKEKLKALMESEIVFLDESGTLIEDSEGSNNLLQGISKLIEMGKKIVFVGGGRLPAVEQNKHIQNALSRENIITKPDQLIEFNPTLLTVRQSEAILVAYRYSETQSSELVKLMFDKKTPLTARVMLMSMHNSGEGVFSLFRNAIIQNYPDQVGGAISHLVVK